MNVRRWFAAAFALLIVTMAACSSSNSSTTGGTGTGTSTEPITLNLWVFNEGGIGSFQETLEKGFEAKYPNIDLKITAYPEDNYGVKLDTAIAAGKEPDLIVFPSAEQVRQGLILPLDNMVQQDKIDISHYVPAIVDGGLADALGCGYQGHLYCLGSYVGSTQMLYNKDMFAKAGIPNPPPWPPMTPEQFVQDACALTDKANGIWGGAASDPLAYLPFDMMWSPDGKTATGYVNGSAFVSQMDLLANGYKQGCFPSSNILDPWEQGRDYFAQGKLAMVITDFQGLDKIDKAGINWGTTAVPTPTGVTPYFFVWTDGVAVMKSSPNPTQAEQFIDYLTTEGAKLREQTEGSIPLDLSIAKQLNWANGEAGREEGLEVLSHARPMVFVPNRWDVAGPYYDAWGFVLAGKKTAQQALDEAAPAIQENLDKAWRNWDENTTG